MSKEICYRRVRFYNKTKTIPKTKLKKRKQFYLQENEDGVINICNKDGIVASIAILNPCNELVRKLDEVFGC